jgi:hypothetical protein
MKAELINLFKTCGCHPELAELKANEALDIVIRWLTQRDVDRATVNRNHICDVLPELHMLKLIDIIHEQEKF